MIKRATCKTWAEWFEKHEGVRISEDTIRNKLKVISKIGVDGRDRLKRVLRNAYYSEFAVREACADLLRPLPQADESDFFELEGVRYGSRLAWSRELGISNQTIARHLGSGTIVPVEGRDAGGRIFDFYPEPAVRAACANLLRSLPQADEKGFFSLDGICFGTAFAWSHKLGISRQSVERRIQASSVSPVEGKDSLGRIHDFYPESAVRAACTDLLKPLPKTEKSGFFVVDGIRHGTVGAWSRELRVSSSAVTYRLRTVSVVSAKGKGSQGRILDYYSEPAVREACSDFFGELPQGDESGFFEIGGIRHGTISAWSRELEISQNSIASRLSSSGTDPCLGRTKSGQLHDFFPEAVLRQACADLLGLSLPVCGSDGFVMINGIHHGTRWALARFLGVSTPTIRSRLASSGIAPVAGKSNQGKLVDLYPEPSVREACAELLAKKKK
ncbi:hypothetical protein HZA44_01680 [Candidatus Peregrinibacteria bacterium]|nr:hypothetical protein [Candidatus Peregrinibacteria bacterium]